MVTDCLYSLKNRKGDVDLWIDDQDCLIEEEMYAVGGTKTSLCAENSSFGGDAAVFRPSTNRLKVQYPFWQ
jgi:hypothetical protein